MIKIYKTKTFENELNDLNFDKGITIKEFELEKSILENWTKEHNYQKLVEALSNKINRKIILDKELSNLLVKLGKIKENDKRIYEINEVLDIIL